MRRSRTLLLPASAAMELSWGYAWATFLTTAVLRQPFPFAEAVLSFVLAAVLTYVSTGRGWRVVAVLALHAAAFLPAARWMAGLFGEWPYSLPRTGGDPISASLATRQWAVMALLLLWGVLFWGGGVALARRGRDDPSVGKRFDLGLSAFLLLLLADFGLSVGGIRVSGPSALFLFPSFFLSGLVAVGAARDSGAEGPSFLPGYRSLGAVLSFVAGVLLLGLGTICLFLPFLGRAADVGYRALSAAGRTSLPYIENALLWFHRVLGGRSPAGRAPEAREPTAAAETAKQAATSGWPEAVGQILVWIVWGVLGAVLLLMIGITLYGVFRWLLSRTADAEPKPLAPELLALWRRVLDRARSLAARVLRRLRPCRTAAQVYEALLGWGRWSGVPRGATETAREYERRLTRSFPALTGEFGAIIEAFHREVYAACPPEAAAFRSARSALRRLRRPCLWPARVKVRWAGDAPQAKSSSGSPARASAGKEALHT
ncbi:MAG: DUF4129 domain-containing protein [Deltaproteobacteria bacterium]|nr:DUF4129 domain-containing protein [Deltaproteobacteria bacterium]